MSFAKLLISFNCFLLQLKCVIYIKAFFLGGGCTLDCAVEGISLFASVSFMLCGIFYANAIMYCADI